MNSRSPLHPRLNADPLAPGSLPAEIVQVADFFDRKGINVSPQGLDASPIVNLNIRSNRYTIQAPAVRSLNPANDAQ